MIGQALVLDDGRTLGRDRRRRPRLRRRGHDGRGTRARAEADRDPARGRARERRAQPQRAERLARLHGRRARRHRLFAPWVESCPTCSPGRSTRRGAAAGPRAPVGHAAARPGSASTGSAASGRSTTPCRCCGSTRRTATSDRRRRELRLPPDADRRRDAALEHGLPRPAPRDRRGRPCREGSASSSRAAPATSPPGTTGSGTARRAGTASSAATSSAGRLATAVLEALAGIETTADAEPAPPRRRRAAAPADPVGRRRVEEQARRALESMPDPGVP